MPDWTHHLRQRLTHLDLDGGREAEIVEELSQHLDERYEELRRHGSSEAEACRVAMDELVDPDSLVEHMRPLRQAQTAESPTPGMPTGSLWADVGTDLRHAMRGLRNQLTFSVVAIFTLALGIGANCAIFALADATLLRALPLPEAEQLVMMSESSTNSSSGAVSATNLNDWQARSQSLQSVAGFVPNVGSMVLANPDGAAQTVPRQWVTAGIFDVLGIQPLVGRTFKPEDDKAERNVVVLSEAFWRSRFNADPGIVGNDLRLDGEMFNVLGVVPEQAQMIGRASMWAMIPILSASNEDRSDRFLRVVGRLRADADLKAASTDMAVVAAGLARDFPEVNQGLGIAIEPLQAALFGTDLRQTAMLFLAVVGFVLLICCANVANLLLARANARRREFAIRAALGANRWRVMRQMLVESLILALLGGALGLLLGALILQIAPNLIPQDLLPGGVELHFDLRVLGFCLLASVLVGLLFGIGPAWAATRQAPAAAIGSETRGSSGRGGKMRNLLVVAEVATAVVLLFGAGLLLRTLLAMQYVDRGYRAGETLTLLVDPIGDRYPTDASLLQFFDEIERQVLASGNVKQLAWSSALPMGTPGGTIGNAAFDVEGAAAQAKGQQAVADYQIVSPGYLSALDIRVLSGREFSDTDRADSVPVCMVNQTFVDTHLGGITPLGARIAIRTSTAPDAKVTVREIVGVSAPVMARATEIDAAPKIYVPLAQRPTDDIFLLVQPKVGSASALIPQVRAAIARVDTEQLVTVSDLMTLEEIAADATSRHRFRAVLVLAFASLALLLAMVGVFGILAWSVQQRVRDFGVRMAVGATANDVLRLVLRGALVLTVSSLLIGLLLAVPMGRWMASVLYGVSPFDPLTLAMVMLVLALTTLLATLVPALKAARVHPVEAMRGY
ncbi:MAG TPA: ABC transporter permease [Dokdonella sp.]|jgi:putative ABC transport system permease protein|uniref:ABC transporter permease n=1 Tax=Dokdonella sp. TaxID=2291710 RepID=UPI002C0B8DF7|nr:ABC transporter permease [Dokdonella sp.]MCC6439958.1 ABC transporter permease [Rhodanobacteraceae bacterium]HNV08638.1 ABC transporter permease [Dokdonella sp.]HPW05022.1 ABC transporter permease [Dokdonella sp.]